MRAKNILVSLVAIFALAILVVPSALALDDWANFDRIGVNEQLTGEDGRVTGVFAGDELKIETVVTIDGNISPIWTARVTARILGESGTLVETQEFVAYGGRTYHNTFTMRVPSDLDPLQETHVLVVTIEGENGVGDEARIDLVVQRDSYLLEIAPLDALNEVKAGDNLAVDVVLKNRGIHKAEDVYLRATIAELGISRTVFYGDLYAKDNIDGDNSEDAVMRRVLIGIPSNVAEGLYTLELEAFNDDSSTVASKKVFIKSSASDNRVVSSSKSKTFASGEEQTYTLTLVNAGNSIMVYDLVVDADSGLSVDLDESVVAVPAGSSKSVQITAEASEEGEYGFVVNVYSEEQLIDSSEFTANVEGRSSAVTGNAVVLLTVILAIVFVVLLVVLIVLLTRKPEKTENYGESYY